MNQDWKSRAVSAADAVAAVRSGTNIFIHGACATPTPLIAALCAEGTSTINNVGQIERGYERIDERLGALGAKIKRVEVGRT